MKAILLLSGLVGLISANNVYAHREPSYTEHRTQKKSYHESTKSNSYGHNSATSYSDDRCSPMCKECHGFNHCKVCVRGWHIVHSADAQWCSQIVSDSSRSYSHNSHHSYTDKKTERSYRSVSRKTYKPKSVKSYKKTDKPSYKPAPVYKPKTEKPTYKPAPVYKPKTDKPTYKPAPAPYKAPQKAY